MLKEVDLIIPIRNIYLVEKPNSKLTSGNDQDHEAQHSLVITTKEKVDIMLQMFTFETRKISNFAANNI